NSQGMATGSAKPAGDERPSPALTTAVASAQQEFRRGQALLEQKQYSKATAAFERAASVLESDDKNASDLRWGATEYASFSRAISAHNADMATRLYTSGAPGVSEPVPLGPFLPPSPRAGTPSNQLAGLDVVIDARGAVESVRLTNPQDRFHD